MEFTLAKRLSQFHGKHKNYGLYTFLFGLFTAAILFIPFIILGNGIFYYYGDFNVQEIPFYQLAHDAVRSGNIGWDHLTDLGTDFISSYSFYLLGSPFFWLTIPFPSEAVPYLIGPLMILKFACASLSAYLYLKRYVSEKRIAMIGGLLYAFSGFSIYNVFFFHFHEPMIVFPLLLAALDAFVYDKKRVVFALAVFSACVVNYYFFTGQVAFVIMYYLMITLTKCYKFRVRDFLLLAVEVLLGFLATAFILLPSVLGLMGNPRIESIPEGWDSIVFSYPQRYWLILLSFFFPSDTPAFPVFTPDSNCKWASVAGWLPLFGMTGVIAYMQTAKRDWLKKLIPLLIVFAFVPVLNSVFQMLNSSIYYARWYYMLVLMLSLATIRALENNETDWNRAIRWSVGLTVGMAAVIGLMPLKTEEEDGLTGEVWSLGVQSSFERFWLYVIVAVMSLLAFVLIYKKYIQNKRRASGCILLGVFIVSLVSSGLVITSGYFSSDTRETIDSNILGKRDNIKIEDIDEVRSDFYECVDNTQMFWQIQSMNCFHSVVNTSIMQFYDALGLTRDVASRPGYSSYGLRAFLSCKYIFDYRGDGKAGSDSSFISADGGTKMPYWKYVETDNGFDIYENECYIPMGYTFDSFITEEEFERVQILYRPEALLYALVLSKETMEKYSDITGYTEEKYELLYGDTPEDFISEADKYSYNYEDYKNNCIERKKTSCSVFEYTDSGFRAEYDNTGGSNLMFFTVPYSDGFSATVNGEEVEIEKVDYGFMAVKIPGYTYCNIEFTYETPGLALGCKISAAAGSALAVYAAAVVCVRCVVYYKRCRRKKEKKSVLKSDG